MTDYNNYRPCMVGGRPAMFHKWHKRQDSILQLRSSFVYETLNTIAEAREQLINTGVVPSYADVKFITNTYAIVEFADGSVRDDIKPEEIRFADSKGLFAEYDFGVEPLAMDSVIEDSFERHLRRAEVNDGK